MVETMVVCETQGVQLWSVVFAKDVKAVMMFWKEGWGNGVA